MKSKDIEKLRRLTRFEDLVAYLRDELDWPIEVEDAEDITFDYEPSELGIDPRHAVKIDAIKQIRPLRDNQPWGIFYVQFESKRLPVVVLRRILRSLVPRSRRRDPNRPIWRMSDLLFISAQGEPGHRSISFAHFRRREGRVAELRTFSWDTRETHFYYIKNLNLEALRWPEDEADASAWREQWRQAFTVEHRYTIQKSQELAKQMARQAALVRDMIAQVYSLETADGPFHQLYDNFKEALLHDLTPEAFADMVAQTVAYGLFSAATQTEDLSFDRVVDLIPNTNPFLKELLAELTSEGTVDLEELGVGQLVEMLRQTDVGAILQDFGRQTGGGREDPVVHFYEDFLREYDKEQKVQRGVFYTPKPVVSFIVRSVDHLLRTELGCSDGLADTSTVESNGKVVPKVTILDLATGTGTFLETAIEIIYETMTRKWTAEGKNETQICAAWNDYVPRHLLPRLHGFELMMAPYVVAHVKLGLKLKQTGYDFQSGERLRVYLANTLEEPQDVSRHLFPDFLASEAQAANSIKQDLPITVVVGNPPYSARSYNLTPYARSLVESYKYIGESKIEEKGALQLEKNLNDDYVKFIRVSQVLTARQPACVIGLITNNSYMENPTLRGMRWSLISDFDLLRFVDLHGNIAHRESASDGTPDENVFDIGQGVAISLLVRNKAEASKKTSVSRVDLVGSRESKYAWLRAHTVDAPEFSTVRPQPPFYLFRSEDAHIRDEYNQGFSLASAVRLDSTGVKTHRDAFCIDFDVGPLRDRVEDLLDPEMSNEVLREKYDLNDTYGWKMSRCRRRLRATRHWQQHFRTILYRPMDWRPVYFHPDVIELPRMQVNQHLIGTENLALVFMRQVAGTEEYTHFTVSRFPVDNRAFYSNRGTTNVAPLYLYSDSSNSPLFDELDSPGVTSRQANFSDEFILDFSSRLNLRFIPDGRGDLYQNYGPEDVLHYMFAVFHSQTYRHRYADFLAIDFPRLPLTSDVPLFRSLVGLGADLVARHLMEDDYGAATWSQAGGRSPLRHSATTFVNRQTGTKMGKFSKRTCYQEGRVYLDTSSLKRSSYFEGVPEDVWNFHIGGYQVLQKWLYDRRETPSQTGRVLTNEDITHYQRIVVALKETMRLMEEIDDAIDAHGGWPIE